MTSLIESYERSYKNDPFFSSGVQYVTKDGVKEKEEGEEGGDENQYEEGGEDEEEHGQRGGDGDEDYADNELRGENLLLLAGIPVYQDPTPVFEDTTFVYEDPTPAYEDPPTLYESLEYESTGTPGENLLLAPIPEYEVRVGRFPCSVFHICDFDICPTNTINYLSDKYKYK